MKIVCLQCQREIGEKFPFDDPNETHTLCPECNEQRLMEAGKEGLRRKFMKTAARKE
jgi:DNA-directed RNA polymerase subunit RPC12/RpoP